MVSPATHAFIGLAGWSVLPDFTTRHLLKVIHRLFPRLFHIPPPAPGTVAYFNHYRYTFSLVVLFYLFYTLFQSVTSVAPNFYELLGVGPTVDGSGLKGAFRRFAKRNHPDRLGPSAGREAEETFMRVRDMYEALKDPVVRFAYDRFGPEVLTWTQCATTREYLRHGLLRSSGYHIVTGVGLLFWSAIGNPSPVAFWRYLLYAGFFASELALLLSPSPSPVHPTNLILSPFSDSTLLHVVFPQRTTFQHILFLHQLFLFLSIALSRIAPKLFPDTPKIGKEVVERVAQLAGLVDREASMMLHTELHSIHRDANSTFPRPSLTHLKPLMHPSDEVLETLTKEMELMIIEANVKRDVGPVRSAWEGAIGRARAASSSNARKGSERARTRELRGHPDITPDYDEEHTLLSPVSSSRGTLPTILNPSILGESDIKDGAKLPSPRPSPPTNAQKKSPGYRRARSASY